MIRFASALVLATLFAAPVAAQSTEIDPRRFSVMGDPYITLDGPAVPHHLDFAIQLAFDYTDALEPQLRVPIFEGGTSLGQPVTDRATMGLAFAMGLFDRFAFGFAVPMIVDQQGEAFDEPYSMQALPSTNGSGLSDPSLSIKALALESGGFRLGGNLEVTLPLGDAQRLFGEPGVVFKPSLLASIAFDRISVAFDLGAVLRPEAASVGSSQPLDSQLAFGVAARGRVLPSLALLAELSGRIGLDDYQFDYASPIEARGAIEGTFFQGFTALLGAGFGLNSSEGAPDFRLTIALRYASSLGFADTDGDGVRDGDDRCLGDAETVNGFDDDDGCPEPDEDDDGTPDASDACPDARGAPADEGCPPDRVDRDRDGVPDARDQCPAEAEDTDGDADEDGCPETQPGEIDSDSDGLMDDVDRCPSEAEETDGFEDEDGCPDTADQTDGDGDGVMDAFDACPAEPGTGEDGCAPAARSSRERQ